MKLLRFLLFVLLFLLSISFQEKDSKIIWGRNLEWKDFECKKTNIHAEGVVAISATNVNYYIIKYTEDTLVLQIFAEFYKNESWKNTEWKLNEYLLKHEQIHFDITELYARKFRKELARIQINKTELDKISDLDAKITKELQTIQDIYDDETNHSILKSKQTEWEIKISKQLKQLELYSHPEIVLKFKK